MNYLFLALLLPQLSIQLPHLALKDVALQPRAGSVHSFDLHRVTPNTVADDASTSDAADSGTIQDIEGRTKYLFPVTVEGHTFQMEMDTGSADTWIIQTGFDCYTTYNVTQNTFSGPQAQSACHFGPTYTPGAGFEANQSLVEITGYGRREAKQRYVRGPVGQVSLNIGGITVQQLIGTPNQTSFPAYGKSKQSGILGMGQIGLTRAYNTSSGQRVSYSPLMQTVFDTANVPAKQFSLALSRDTSKTGNGGVFTIGGLPSNTPSVNISDNQPTSADLQLFTPYSKTQPTFYSILVDNFFIVNTTYNASLQILIDSGANTFEVPAATAKIMNSLWSPPSASGDATKDLPCNAVLTHKLGITIGGRKYHVNDEDLIHKNKTGACHSLIASGSDSNGYLIGDPFLKNVAAVFDWEASSMHFYPRQYYKS